MVLGPAAAPLVPGAGERRLPEDLEGACRALEKAFAQIVFQKMREAMVPASDGGAAGFARTSAAAMLDAQWAELASQGEGLGLWRSLYRQLEPAAVKSGAAGPDERIRGSVSRTSGSGALGEPGPVPRRAPVAAVDGYRRVDSLRRAGPGGGPQPAVRNHEDT